LIHAKARSLTARKVIRALKRAGFVEDRQELTKALTVVPVHRGRTIKEPLLRAIVRDANLPADKFFELL
jgi:predicted RNA binding protein YcfA (HicA-like mRNA interferase family)